MGMVCRSRAEKGRKRQWTVIGARMTAGSQLHKIIGVDAGVERASEGSGGKNT